MRRRSQTQRTRRPAYGIAVDEGPSAYWVVGAGAGTAELRRRVKDATAPEETLAVLPSSAAPLGVALDAQYVYWTEYGSGRVMRVAR